MLTAIISLLFLKLIKKTGVEIPAIENFAYQLQLKYGHLRGLGLEGIKKVYKNTVKITKPAVQSIKKPLHLTHPKKIVQKTQNIQKPINYFSGSHKGGLKI